MEKVGDLGLFDPPNPVHEDVILELNTIIRHVRRRRHFNYVGDTEETERQRL